MNMKRQSAAALLGIVLVALLLPVGGMAWGQVPPTATEVAAYRGLHAAAYRGDRSAIAALVASGADLNAGDHRGRTPLHLATHARRTETVVQLIQAGARLDLQDHDRYDAVTIAAVADDEVTLAALLGLGASARMVTSRYDGTALIAAAHLGHDGVVRQLIRAGAPLNHVNNLHWTAVIEAIVLGDGGVRHQSTLQALIEAGADVQLPDGAGRTPLQLARQRGYAAMVKMLERAGAR